MIQKLHFKYPPLKNNQKKYNTIFNGVLFVFLFFLFLFVLFLAFIHT